MQLQGAAVGRCCFQREGATYIRQLAVQHHVRQTLPSLAMGAGLHWQARMLPTCSAWSDMPTTRSSHSLRCLLLLHPAMIRMPSPQQAHRIKADKGSQRTIRIHKMQQQGLVTTYEYKIYDPPRLCATRKMHSPCQIITQLPLQAHKHMPLIPSTCLTWLGSDYLNVNITMHISKCTMCIIAL